MEWLKILAHISNFVVVGFIGLKTLGTECFDFTDVNLSLSALVFSLMVEVIYIKERQF